MLVTQKWPFEREGGANKDFSAEGVCFVVVGTKRSPL